MIHCCVQILLKNGSSMLRYLTFFSVILLPVAGSCRGDIVYQFTPSATSVPVNSSFFAAQSFNTGNYNQINSISTTFGSMDGHLPLQFMLLDLRIIRLLERRYMLQPLAQITQILAI